MSLVETSASLRLELFVTDLGASVAFYRDVLGFDVVRVEPDYAAMRLDSVELGLGRFADLPARHPLAGGPGARLGAGVEIVLEVSDITVAHKHVATAGYRIHSQLQTRPWGLTDFRLLDPDGFYVRVTSRERGVPVRG